MPAPTEIKDLPPDKVTENVDQLIQTGAEEINCIKQSNGKWTIRAK
jgi:hypothetical protein